MKGYSLIEALIVIGITLILSVMTLTAFGYFRTTQALGLGTENIASFIEKARHQTLEGLNGSQYGVHFTSVSAILFEGTTYVPNAASNEMLSFPGGLIAAQITLAGGGSDVVFQYLTGNTSQPGTIILQAGSDAPSAQKTITISAAGIVTVH